MMSIRAVWILTAQEKQAVSVKLLFSRSFPTVEKRAKHYGGTNYIQLPETAEFAQALYDSLGIHSSSEFQFLPKRDTCKKVDQKPVYEVQTAFGALWPVVAFEQFGLWFCCLPLIEGPCDTPEQRPPIVKCPGISAGFTLLLGMQEFLGSIPNPVSQENLKFADLYLYLNEAAPFGTPVNTNPNTTRLHLRGKVPSLVGNSGEKIAAWRPNPHKGKSSLHFLLKEKIRAVQYDNPSMQDAMEIYGTLMCNAEVDGVIPEVTVILDKSAGSSTSAHLDSLLTHPCVQAVETGTKGASSDGQKSEITKLAFTPPTENFPLCHYTIKYTDQPPIKAYYQMKGETNVEVLVQLKLSERMKNVFEYCELQLPFSHRGTILSVDSSPSHGTVLISPNKKTLVWDIGQRFPSKSLEVILKATLQFGCYTPEKTSQGDHAFCSGQNAYAQLLFKVSDFTYSGLEVDQKSVNILPQTKAKVSTAAEFQSVNYKIWNSHGDAPIAFHPPEDLFLT